jgi:hypothetical protein
MGFYVSRGHFRGSERSRHFVNMHFFLSSRYRVHLLPQLRSLLSAFALGCPLSVPKHNTLLLYATIRMLNSVRVDEHLPSCFQGLLGHSCSRVGYETHSLGSVLFSVVGGASRCRNIGEQDLDFGVAETCHMTDYKRGEEPASGCRPADAYSRLLASLRPRSPGSHLHITTEPKLLSRTFARSAASTCGRGRNLNDPDQISKKEASNLLSPPSSPAALPENSPMSNSVKFMMSSKVSSLLPISGCSCVFGLASALGPLLKSPAPAASKISKSAGFDWGFDSVPPLPPPEFA